MVEPVVTCIIAVGVGALLSGGGTGAYLSNKHQKERKKLQDIIASLQKKLLKSQTQLTEAHQWAANLQQKFANNEKEKSKLLKKQVETDLLIMRLETELVKHVNVGLKV